MDAVSYANSAKQAQRIKKFIENPDSTSGVLTQPKVIEVGETVTIKSGRQAILADTVVDGDLVIEAGGDVFVPAGAGFSDLDQRIDTLYSTAVKLTGTQTIGGYKTFSSPIRGSFLKTVVFADSAGNDFTNSNIEIRGNGSTIKPGIGFHQPALYAGTLEMFDANTFQFKTQTGQLATVAKSPNDSGVKTALNASGNAPIYACRAWVNFNGDGTVAIRASGNVSSITDNGVGNYTVNFTTAMPDANYTAIGCDSSTGNNMNVMCSSLSATNLRVIVQVGTSAAETDSVAISTAIFR